MAPEPGPLFFDTVTLANFALASRLDLLTERYGPRAFITPEVLGEVLEGVVAGYPELQGIEEALESGGLGEAGPPTAEERRAYRTLLPNLSPGEASCIAYALKRSGIVVTDDRAARSACEERGVRCTGTIGILKACVHEEVLSPAEADAILSRMIEAGYYAPVRRISDLL